MLIRLDVLQLIQKLSKNIPYQTPKRTNIIYEQLQMYCMQFKEENNYVKMVINSPYTTFTNDFECVEFLLRKVPRISLGIDQYFYGVTVLVPPEVSCCSSKYRLDPRHATIKLFDIHGVKNCLYFHGMCSNCKASYYYKG